MVGLIAALTPVLYTHISDRKEEISNINKANTMLQLQRETEQFLKDKDKRESLVFTDGKATLSPSGLNSNLTTLNNKYLIGFKEGTNGSVSAVIVEKEGSGNDVKAAKIASLIGVSAGIKSAMDTDNAYGVNGLWKESLSDYGVENVPDGSTVVTTEYDKEKKTYYTSDMIVDSDIDMGEHKLKARKIVTDAICIGGDDEEHCKGDWEDIGNTKDSDLILLTQCLSDIEEGKSANSSTYCVKAVQNGLFDDCGSIAKTYLNAGLRASSGYYYTGGDFSRQKVCYFVNGAVPSSYAEVIEACNDSDNPNRKFACMYDWQTGSYATGSPYEGGKKTTSCATICNGLGSNCKSSATGYYTIVSSYSETGFTAGRATPCIFGNGREATVSEIIEQCNENPTSTSAACAKGYLSGYNRSCENIISSANGSDSGYYAITSGATKNTSTYANYNVTYVSTSKPCYFYSSTSVGTAAQTIAACNSANNVSNIACAFGYDNNYNRSCANILSYGGNGYADSANVIMSELTEGSTNQTCAVDNCATNNTSGACYYNRNRTPSKKYCNDTTCGQYCDDDTDCDVYNAGYICVTDGTTGNKTCKAKGANGDTLGNSHHGTNCSSGYAINKVCKAACATGYKADANGDCYTECSTSNSALYGSIACANGYYCNGTACGSCDTGYAYDGSRNCYTSCSTGSTHCASNYYCNSSACINSCSPYGNDSNRNCKTSCTSGTSDCAGSSYCINGTCSTTYTSTSCGTVGSNSYNLNTSYSRQLNGNTLTCCSASTPVYNSGSCVRCMGSTQSSCASGYVCSSNTCVQDTPAMCTDSSGSYANDAWIGNAQKCDKAAGCTGTRQIARRDSGVSGYSCNRPYPAGACLTFPAAGSSSTSWKGSYTIYHFTITTGGKTYHFVGPYVSWWEAESICESLGLNLQTYDALVSMMSSYGGYSALYTYVNNNYSPSSTTYKYFWTKDDYGNTCNAYNLLVYSSTYHKYDYNRYTNSNRSYAVCS